VRLAFAMTFSKSQGQSLKTVGINLSNPCFSDGQFYVAYSQVGMEQSLYVHTPNSGTRNIVYPTVLENK